MQTYKMNFATKTITITKAFAAMAMKPNSEEANLLTHLRAICPDLQIAYKTCSSKKHPFKGLTYNKMERYILLCENPNEKLLEFIKVKELARTQSNPHNFVCKWFLQQYPEYKEMPTLKDGKIVPSSATEPTETKETETTTLAA